MWSDECFIQQDLHERIDRARYTDPLEDSGFQYGFNSTHLKKVVSYWRHEFDWKKQVAVLNKYPHFKTRIEGTTEPKAGFALGIWPPFFFSLFTCFFASLQDWTCTSSMWCHHTARIRRSCLLCSFTAGPAPSTSSTGFCRFSRRTTMVSRLRSYAHPSLATVSQTPLVNKVDDK